MKKKTKLLPTSQKFYISLDTKCDTKGKNSKREEGYALILFIPISSVVFFDSTTISFGHEPLATSVQNKNLNVWIKSNNNFWSFSLSIQIIVTELDTNLIHGFKNVTSSIRCNTIHKSNVISTILTTRNAHWHLPNINLSIWILKQFSFQPIITWLSSQNRFNVQFFHRCHHYLST